jgi:hypothetical protein
VGEDAKSVSEGNIYAFSKAISREQKVGKFLITAEGDILRIFKSEGGVKDKADKDTAPVAFFRVSRRRRSPPSTPPGRTSPWAARTARCCSSGRRCC